MRKTILIFLVVILAVTTLFSGCSGVYTEKKDFSNFTAVDVENIFTVEIVQSNTFSIEITANEGLREYVDVSQEGETLKIALSPHHVFTDFTRRTILKAKVTMPALYGLSLTGAAKGTVSGFESTHDFTFNVDGASSLNIKDMETGKIESEISGASSVTGSINATDAKFEVSGASKVDLDGSGNNLILNVSGASNLNLTKFIVNTADVNLSGASQATLDVKEKMAVILSGASKLYFYDNPTIANISITGASTIKHK